MMRMTGKRTAWKRLTFFLLFLMLVLVLSGCGDYRKTKQMKELREQGITLLSSGDYEGAVKAFDSALDLETGKPGAIDIDILQYRAEAEYRSGDFKAADYTYSQLITEDAERPEYLDMRCICQVKSGSSLKDALSFYQKADAAKKKADTHQEALLGLGDSLASNSDAQDQNEAVTLYQNALQGKTYDDTVNAELTGRIGMIYYRQKNYDEALKWFSEGASDYPSDKSFLYNEACCYEYLTQYQKALDLFNKYISQFGKDENAEHEILFLKSRLHS